MKERIKNSWLILLINVLIAAAYITVIGFSKMLFLSEGLFLVGFYFKILRPAPTRTTNVTLTDNILHITGIFQNLKIPRADISDIAYKRDLMAWIFDWDVVTITTPHKRISLYVRRSHQIAQYP